MSTDTEGAGNSNLRDDAGDEWSRDAQKLAALSWVSFLAACVGSMLMFAYLDPLIIVDSLGLDSVDSRNAGYAIGFFCIWAYTWVSGWLVLRLTRRKRNWPRRP